MSDAIAFKDMPYERPDVEGLRRRYDELTERLVGAEGFDEAKAVFIEKDCLDRTVDTLQNLAFIRHSIDTRDSFYKGEKDFWDEASPKLQASAHKWTKALLDHPQRKRLEEEFGSVLFVNAEIERRSFDPAIIEEMQQENKLVSEYGRLIASAQVPFQGKTYTLSQLTPFKTDADDAVRHEAWVAEGRWYKEHQAELDRIYDELVHLRDAMGKKLGHDGYLPLGYDRMCRNCYDRHDVERFREAVQRHLVPLCDRIFRDQAERIGVAYPLSFADEALMFRSGNPRPAGDADAILEAGRTFYDELSPETSEFFRMMLDRGLLDVLSTEGKEGGGYCTAILDHRAPFIFANFNGTQGDVDVITHEAGHAFEVWLNIDRVPCDYAWPSMEACEVHSMSMEFFAWPWVRHFFGDDERKYLYSHLAGAVTFIPYGTMVDHFQHIVYERPDMTPAERHGVWKELLGTYMPWLRLDGEIPFYAEGMGWQRQKHIYEMPLYYIDYCLAQTVALSFWAMIQEDAADAWKHYMAYTRLGGSRTFTELLGEAGLESPFDEGCLRGICERASAWLDAFDLSGM